MPDYLHSIAPSLNTNRRPALRPMSQINFFFSSFPFDFHSDYRLAYPKPFIVVMDYTLRCNQLKCRVELRDRAIVTTCSHIFCIQCGDTTGFSRSDTATRACLACSTLLANQDDVVIADLNPSEEYKTCILSGLNPAAIMDCASRGLSFFSYQTSQEILYQDHLAKSLTDRYSTLNQQMDQLVHDANAQIKILQDKIQNLQMERSDLEKKNHELGEAFREKSVNQQKIQKMYQQLKAQVMATQVVDAAGDEADLAIYSTRNDRFINKIPGAQSGASNLPQLGTARHKEVGKHYNSGGSGSSGGNEVQRGEFGLGPQYGAHVQSRNVGGTVNNRGLPGTPSQPQTHRSRLPVLGGQRPLSNVEVGSDYQAPPLSRQVFGGNIDPRVTGNQGFVSQLKRPKGAVNLGPIRR
ncbi:unnamed protein product [Periconia digitata]|uniref:RING-type domain-containing protein n=1 Tax=Periconia digitata TaxID=1303443 RepID=A0A9W4U261_9PLEO|nr:unnamed protein product [Periconia digitata]